MTTPGENQPLKPATVTTHAGPIDPISFSGLTSVKPTPSEVAVWITQAVQAKKKPAGKAAAIGSLFVCVKFPGPQLEKPVRPTTLT